MNAARVLMMISGHSGMDSGTQLISISMSIRRVRWSWITLVTSKLGMLSC